MKIKDSSVFMIMAYAIIVVILTKIVFTGISEIGFGVSLILLLISMATSAILDRLEKNSPYRRSKQ